jgi:hypothetical protein
MAEIHLPHHGGASHGTSENPEVHHETSDVNIRAIFGFGAGLIVVAIGIHFIVWLLFMYFAAREAQRVPLEYPLAASQGERLPPEPRLQVTPRQDLGELRASEDETLATYGWVDRNAGIVRIPIDEAMRLTLERGLPTRTGQKP